MQITKRQIMDFPYLPKIIAADERKLERYKNNPPVAIHGKVMGSNSVFPYQLRSFTVSGPDFDDSKEWEQKVRYLEVKIASEKRFYEQLMVDIDTMIASIFDVRDKLVMEYIVSGKKQQQVAMLLNMDQSTVSRTIDKYVI